MSGEHRRFRFAKLAVAASLVVAILGVAGSAFAQVPSVPDLPAPVTNAITTVQATVYPYLFSAAQQGSAVATLGGFALRPGCGELGYAAFLAAVAGPSLPVGVVGLLSPVFIFCSGAFAPGPVDPYLGTVDQTAGPQLSSVWAPIVAQAHKLRTTTPQAGTYFQEGCSVVGFAPPSSEFPPPLQRIGYESLFC
jgi:hypothetical protein